MVAFENKKGFAEKITKKYLHDGQDLSPGKLFFDVLFVITVFPKILVFNKKNMKKKKSHLLEASITHKPTDF